jgi:hypothetical protein
MHDLRKPIRKVERKLIRKYPWLIYLLALWSIDAAIVDGIGVVQANIAAVHKLPCAMTFATQFFHAFPKYLVPVLGVLFINLAYSVAILGTVSWAITRLFPQTKRFLLDKGGGQWAVVWAYGVAGIWTIVDIVRNGPEYLEPAGSFYAKVHRDGLIVVWVFAIVITIVILGILVVRWTEGKSQNR